MSRQSNSTQNIPTNEVFGMGYPISNLLHVVGTYVAPSPTILFVYLLEKSIKLKTQLRRNPWIVIERAEAWPLGIPPSHQSRHLSTLQNADLIYIRKNRKQGKTITSFRINLEYLTGAYDALGLAIPSSIFQTQESES